MALLVRGNSKLGKEIWTFSIPASFTCPGKSDLCNTRCYAQKGMFHMPNVQQALQRRLEETKKRAFVNKMVYEINKVKASIVRIHVAGDMYDAEYAEKWYSIIRACPATVFFVYTRSWRVPKIVKVLQKLSTLGNLRLWYSVDAETGLPRKVPKKVRLAYMAVSVADIPDNKVDLVFRDYDIRAMVQKRINGVLVCPVENGITPNITCTKCKLCWRQADVPKNPPDMKLFTLPLVR